MTSLNAEKGKAISELEMMFAVVKKVMFQQTEDHPTRKLTLAKGKPNETTMTLKEALNVLEGLELHMATKGVMSFGICGACARWNNKGSSTGHTGFCGNDVTSRYDTCNKHSRKGGGFGL